MFLHRIYAWSAIFIGLALIAAGLTMLRHNPGTNYDPHSMNNEAMATQRRRVGYTTTALGVMMVITFSASRYRKAGV